MSNARPLRVAIYGAGRFANQTHIPNLRTLAGVQIVALCDTNPQARSATAAAFGIAKTYDDGHAMLAGEALDALYSVVPAFARTDVEAAAAARCIHLFCEKPQARTMAVALAIDAAIRQAGVVSTVGFRERYRPLFQEARRLLRGKAIYHVRFQMANEIAPVPLPAREDSWKTDFAKHGGHGFDWGVHAVDTLRFMTGLEFTRIQSFYHRRPEYTAPVAWMFNGCLSNGGTAQLAFVSAQGAGREEPWFTVYYEGGRLAIYAYDRIEVNGKVVYRGDVFDPWLAQTQAFIHAARTGDTGRLLSDFHDGLYSLAPILAGWQSAEADGQTLEVAALFQESMR